MQMGQSGGLERDRFGGDRRDREDALASTPPTGGAGAVVPLRTGAAEASRGRRARKVAAIMLRRRGRGGGCKRPVFVAHQPPSLWRSGAVSSCVLAGCGDGLETHHRARRLVVPTRSTARSAGAQPSPSVARPSAGLSTRSSPAASAPPPTVAERRQGRPGCPPASGTIRHGRSSARVRWPAGLVTWAGWEVEAS